MIDLTLNYPIPIHKTWDIIDSSKLMCFMDCPRKYFFEYILGWRPEGSSIHLVFGEAWHAMMEKIYQHGYNKEGIAAGYDAFLSIYRNHFSPEEDELYAPKTPETALEAAAKYIIEYMEDDFEVYGTEIAGTVPVSENRAMHFKIDLITRSESDSFSLWDHKTTGWSLNAIWTLQWANRCQFLLYKHALHAYLSHYKGLSDAHIDSLIVNGIGMKRLKTGPKIEFLRYYLPFVPSMQLAWLHEVNSWLDFLIQQHEHLAGCRVEDQFMSCFPRSGTGSACTQWNKQCYLYDLCTTTPNPLQLDKPVGFKTEYWNPMDVSTIKERVEL